MKSIFFSFVLLLLLGAGVRPLAYQPNFLNNLAAAEDKPLENGIFLSICKKRVHFKVKCIFIYKEHLILKKRQKKSKMEFMHAFSITAEFCIAIIFLLTT